MSRSAARQHTPLTITELAVDPADVDETTYPVRVRLSRQLTGHEVQALAQIVPGAGIEGDALVLPDTSLDDVAHSAEEWTRLLERAESLGEGRDGESDRAAADAQARMTEQHRDLTRESSVQNYMH